MKKKEAFWIFILGVFLVSFGFVLALPNISLFNPTPENNDLISNNTFSINISTFDENNLSFFIDYNHSLVSWWKMDEVNQTEEGALVYDNSTFGNDIVAKGNAIQVENGFFGKGFGFDGTGDSLDLGSAISSIENLGEGTISLWFKTTDRSSGTYVLLSASDKTDTDSAFTIFLYQGQLRVLIREAGSYGSYWRSSSS